MPFEDFLRETTAFEPHEWQSKHLCPILDSLLVSKGQRILVHGPPQFGKSLLVSKRFPAFALGTQPELRIILAGYNVGHARGFCEVVRDIMHGPEYKARFPDQRCWIPKPCRAEAFSTVARAALRDGQDSLTAVGLLSGFTGKGADILIIDDPYASPDQAKSEAINERVWRWWNELAKVRLGADTNVLVMFHRYHENDFAGRLMAEGGWRYFRFPAVADENEDEDDPTGREIGQVLSPMRTAEWLRQFEDRDPQTWLSQFQGRPRPIDGTFLKREWLKTTPLTHVPPLEVWVRFWDLATTAKKTGDFTSGALVGVGPDQALYIRDITRFRAELPEARQIITDITQQDAAMCQQAGAHYEVGVENVAWMRSMIQDMFSLPLFKRVRLNPTTAKGDKKERASGWVARAKADSLRLVLGAWNDDFIKECLAFDGLGVVHDDQVDSVSGAYEMLWSTKGELLEVPQEPEVGSIAYYRKRQNEPPKFWGF